MAEDFEHGDKTEQPTDRRRQEIRERGNVVRSVDLNAAASVLAAAAVLYLLGGDLATALARALRESLAAPAWTEIDTPSLLPRVWSLVGLVSGALLPLLGLMLATAVAVNVAQVGFLLTTEPLQPNFGRLNPAGGLRRILSLHGTARLVGSLLKLGVLVAIVIGFVVSRLPAFLHTIDAETASLCRQIGIWMAALAFQLAIGLAALALLDYGFQYWKFEQEIKMTRQEIRDEMRHMEGDPHIRQRRREAHRKLVGARQVLQTKKADVVVTNPTEIAVAIQYDSKTMQAPIVVAKGKGGLAQRIRKIAIENGIPIIEKKPLAQALFRMVRVGHAIPVELYEAVAEILAYVYRLSNKKLKRA